MAGAVGLGVHRGALSAGSPEAVFAPERIAALTAAIARCGDQSGSMEGAARCAVAALRDAFPTAEGQSALVLVRFFQTARWELLTPQLRSYALARMAPGAGGEGTRCLALLATLGDQPAWCDRHASRDHQALPLAGAEVVRRMPLALTVLDHLVGADAQRGGHPPHTPAYEPRPTRVAVHLVSQVAGSPLVPAQWLADGYGVASALGLGGILPSGEVFSAVIFSRVPIDAPTAQRFGAVTEALCAALSPFAHLPLFDPARPVGRVVPHADGAPAYDERHNTSPILPPASLDSSAGWSVQPRPSVEAALRDQRERLAQESRIVETLYSVGQSLARQLDLGKLVQQAIEAATSVVGARFGAFLYTTRDAEHTARRRFALAGAPPESFARLGEPHGTALFATDPPNRATVRCVDVTRDARYGGSAPHHGMPAGHPPVRSYLSVPVVAANGELLGSFYFGHPEPGVFTERDEQLAQGIAAQAASAMENSRLYRHERATAMRLQRSLLPAAPSRVGDLDVATAYLPGEQGARVGGDWFDVIALSADRVALVIGDVMGRGIGAAAVMGQLRAAIQAYAVMDLPPAQVLDQLNNLVCRLPREQIATCVYAVYDPCDGTVRWANAGHLPPALVGPDGTVTLLEADLGMPLGVDTAVFADASRPLPQGARLLLYTDGLVECRDQPLHDRLAKLRAALGALCRPEAPVNVQEGAARLAEAMLTGTEHDDVAVLYVAAQPGATRKASVTLSPTLEAARAARRFARKTTADWGLDELTDSVLQIVSELVTNAVEHAGTPMELRLRQRHGALLIEVADGDGRPARQTPTDRGDERHRGLMIVQTLSERWGVRQTVTGKVVWAQLAGPERDEPGAPGQAETPTPAIRSRPGRRAAAVAVPHAPAAR
ncbi:SpoIIE family protein phosphatase [Actinocrinis puniceicyclus]|uniref:SpoIIE family protein phosphatase n=1 Tax=Actinocrinis puniceicyclus TaxID=977794 RepID=UPI0028B14E11|nr:SpoIIE family protein phosphatase [Actinocrinis puniceicyclus]